MGCKEDNPKTTLLVISRSIYLSSVRDPASSPFPCFCSLCYCNFLISISVFAQKQIKKSSSKLLHHLPRSQFSLSTMRVVYRNVR
ncbi:hypothetical protein MANES_12G114666v8 [Manihot esculenta]|uniref:Uncharacterized protein n=1 Tax=Manihot esculenta TaxID=3983 RepID=A0ACB7GR06_MANES|nr:hypothetical protein MANES_12G114666v8 [Manihot esculenta]